MAWTNPTTRSAGDAILASDQNIWVNNFRMGQPVFTNEAARDAALTSPEEGMVAYLTSSTVATATGAVTAIPSGVTTIYNGSAWVCRTEVGGSSYTSGTTTSGTYVTTLTGDGQVISATLVTGTTAFITGWLKGSVNAAATVAIAVSVSGATTIPAASSNFAATFASATGGYQFSIPLMLIATGLTAGTNTFTLNYATANTLTAIGRALTVKGIA
jgi:hypothetical protein